MVASAIHNLLARALRQVKLEFSIDDGIEDQLLKAARLDANDFNTRNRLRMLRLCRVLCSDQTLSELSTMAVCGLPIEDLQYELFGRAGAKPTLQSLIHPRTSLIAKCRGRHLALAQS
jgi:hypothetical protein